MHPCLGGGLFGFLGALEAGPGNPTCLVYPAPLLCGGAVLFSANIPARCRSSSSAKSQLQASRSLASLGITRRAGLTIPTGLIFKRGRLTVGLQSI
jgi:hypothetical protein